MATAQEIAAAQAMVKMGMAPPPISIPQGPVYWSAPGHGAAAPKRRKTRMNRKSRKNRKSRRTNRR